MEWNVILFDPNLKRFKKYNVFNNAGFYDDVVKFLSQNNLTWKDMSNMIMGSAAYRFKHRCEYEIVLESWPKWECEQKIDVLYQLELNWDLFIDYIMEFYNG
jgi:hypothetical protein